MNNLIQQYKEAKTESERARLGNNILFRYSKGREFIFQYSLDTLVPIWEKLTVTKVEFGLKIGDDGEENICTLETFATDKHYGFGATLQLAAFFATVEAVIEQAKSVTFEMEER